MNGIAAARARWIAPRQSSRFPSTRSFLYRDPDDFIIADIAAIEKETGDSPRSKLTRALLPLLPLGSYRNRGSPDAIAETKPPGSEARFRVDGIEISRAPPLLPAIGQRFRRWINSTATFTMYTGYRQRLSRLFVYLWEI